MSEKKEKPDIRDFSIQNEKSLAGTTPDKIDTPDSKDGSKIDEALRNTPEPQETEFDLDALEDDLFEKHMEFLKEKGVTEDDLFQALDTIITSGTLIFSFKLFDKILVTFRLRPQWVNEYVAKIVETENPQTYARFADIVGSWNLAGSLMQMGDKQFELNNLDDLKVVWEHISNLGFPIKARLAEKLALFDRMVSVATSEWCVENFSKPR